MWCNVGRERRHGLSRHPCAYHLVSADSGLTSQHEYLKLCEPEKPTEICQLFIQWRSQKLQWLTCSKARAKVTSISRHFVKYDKNWHANSLSEINIWFLNRPEHNSLSQSAQVISIVDISNSAEVRNPDSLAPMQSKNMTMANWINCP